MCLMFSSPDRSEYQTSSHTLLNIYSMLDIYSLLEIYFFIYACPVDLSLENIKHPYMNTIITYFQRYVNVIFGMIGNSYVNYLIN